MRNHDSKGFTLIEMVVVIAIITVLLAVTVPTVQGLMNRARFSQDTQHAARMTQVLKVLKTEGVIDDFSLLKPHDVRVLLEGFSDDGFVFRTASNDSGFFYDPSLGVVHAFAYETLLEKTTFHKQALTAHTSIIIMPEAVFSNEYLLLSHEGDTVADLVWGIRNGVPKEALETRIIDSDYSVRLQALLNAFDLSQTLFIDHASWVTEAETADEIARIYFAPGISHIPTFSLAYVIGGEITMPQTVKTIDKHAFIHETDGIQTPAFEAVNFKGSGSVRMHEDAYLTDETSIHGKRIEPFVMPSWNPLWGTLDVRVMDDLNTLDLGFVDERFKEALTAYAVESNGIHKSVRFFSASGLIAVWDKAIEGDDNDA